MLIGELPCKFGSAFESIAKNSEQSARFVGTVDVEIRLPLFSFQVVLKNQPDALRAASVVANGVDAIGIAEIDFPRVVFGTVSNAESRAGMRVAGLFESVNIIDARHGADGGDVPALFPVERKRILSAEQNETARADFLEIISRQRKRKF